jgi:DNA processing protein
LKASASELEAVPLIGSTLANRFAKAFKTIDPREEWQRIQQHQVALRLLGEPDYPPSLATIPDPPPLLYTRGTFEESDANAVGIVGSRACTAYGRRMAESLARDLAQAGWTVVSGLARGIDGVAHAAALKAGGRTIGVLAGGLSEIYPPEHKELAEACARQGAILTETPMTVDPQPGMFPARNRIISGLSRGIVVIEAHARSGALITATHAAEQGREVFALAGNADSPASAGCLELIRKGARLVRNAEDILEDLRGLSPPTLPPNAKRKPLPPQQNLFTAEERPAPERPTPLGPQLPHGLDSIQQKIWEALSVTRHADELARELQLPAGELTVHLMKLEMKKVIRRLPGNHFERTS